LEEIRPRGHARTVSWGKRAINGELEETVPGELGRTKIKTIENRDRVDLGGILRKTTQKGKSPMAKGQRAQVFEKKVDEIYNVQYQGQGEKGKEVRKGLMGLGGRDSGGCGGKIGVSKRLEKRKEEERIIAIRVKITSEREVTFR